MKFLTICHSGYSTSHIPIIKGNEYIAVYCKSGYNVYTLDNKWITVFSGEFRRYFYTKEESDKIREIRLDKILNNDYEQI
jgi:hypothetical protein